MVTVSTKTFYNYVHQEKHPSSLSSSSHGPEEKDKKELEVIHSKKTEGTSITERPESYQDEKRWMYNLI